MNPFLAAIAGGLLWYGLGLLFALCLWPLLRRFLPSSIAWGSARILGPYLVAWLALLPAALLGQAAFSRASCLAAAAACAAAAWAIGGTLRGGLEKEEFSEVLRFEGFYLPFLLSCCLFLPFMSSALPFGERMMDSSFVTGVWAQRSYPMQDPWLAGYPLRYYVFGYYPVWAVGFLSGQNPLVVYNMALAFTFANYASGLYLLLRACSLQALPAALGALAVALGSNLKSLLEAFGAAFQNIPYNAWAVSRVISNTINEFPFWSFTLGDLHPHFLALPLFVLLLTFTAALILQGPEESKNGEYLWAAAAGMLTGFVWGANTWETPIFLGVAWFAVLLTHRKRPLTRSILICAGVALAALLTASPLFRARSQLPLEFGWVRQRSSAAELSQVFGLFLLPLAAHFWARWAKRPSSPMIHGLAASLFLFPFLVRSGLILVSLLAALAAVSLWLEPEGRTRLGLIFALAGLGILLVCELFHLADVYGDARERMNTVFKFYMPAWTLLGSAAVLFLSDFKSRLRKSAAAVLVCSWGLALSAHAAFGLSVRTAGFRSPEALDGLAQLRAVAPGDAALVSWMQERAKEGRLSGVLLEAVGPAYSYFTRFSSLSGLPSYLGWEDHLFVRYRGHPGTGERSRKAAEIFSGALLLDGAKDCRPLRAVLRGESISYVAVGSLERSRYPPPGLAALRSCLYPLYEKDGTALLAVSGGTHGG
ncbi:MAG: DUF2298 domain-containing protein [Elusimicrobia bacterium]|nr:DUF2298 domain-containing protein [Elusimicrobiota bacterium]